MPIYDYRCDECGHDFWLIESLSEHDEHAEDQRACPSCGSKRVRRVISAANVHTTRKS